MLPYWSVVMISGFVVAFVGVVLHAKNMVKMFNEPGLLIDDFFNKPNKEKKSFSFGNRAFVAVFLIALGMLLFLIGVVMLIVKLVG